MCVYVCLSVCVCVCTELPVARVAVAAHVAGPQAQAVDSSMDGHRRESVVRVRGSDQGGDGAPASVERGRADGACVVVRRLKGVRIRRSPTPKHHAGTVSPMRAARVRAPSRTRRDGGGLVRLLLLLLLLLQACRRPRAGLVGVARTVRHGG
jgi:hypothetical protein